MVELITKPSCQPCVATKRWLDSRGIAFTESSITEEAVLARAKGLGHLAAPVVIVGDQHWSGFRPDMLEKHAAGMLV